MSQLRRTEFDNFEITPDYFDDTMASFHDVSQGNDGSLDLENAILVLGDIEKEVVRKYESNVLFSKFNE